MSFIFMGISALCIGPRFIPMTVLAVLADGCDGEVAEEPAVDVGVTVDFYRAEEDGDA